MDMSDLLGHFIIYSKRQKGDLTHKSKAKEELKIKELYLYSSIVLVVLFCFCTQSNTLNEKKAAQIINAHFEDFYGGFQIQKYRYEFLSSSQEYTNQIQYLESIKNLGLIDYRIINQDGLFMKKRVIDVFLTEAGENTHHIFHENDNNRLGFIMGKRKLSKIIEVNKDDNTVLFSYSYKPNDAGIALGQSESNYRGKAKIVYDPFLEKYVFKGMLWSPWEKEEWISTNWYYEIDGERVFTNRSGLEE